MANNSLIDTTAQLLEANLDRRVAQHRQISRNLANVDTPNYMGTGLEFEKQLRAALDGGILPASMSKTHPMHMPYEPAKPFSNAKPDYKNTGPVHLDIEMSRLAENNIMFNAMIQMLTKKMDILKTAIQEGSK